MASVKSGKNEPGKPNGGPSSSPSQAGGDGGFRPYFTHKVSGNTFYAADYGHKAWPIGR